MDLEEFRRQLNKQQRKIIAQVERETGEKVPAHLKKEYTLEETKQILQMGAGLPPNHFLFDDTEFKTAQEMYKMSMK